MKKRSRLIDLVRTLLRQGTSPRQIGLALALGTSISVCPIVGLSTILCTIVALALRLNIPLIQLANYAVVPLQLLLIVPFIRFGERLFGALPLPLAPEALLALIREEGIGFFIKFAATGMHAVTAWLLVFPLLLAVLYVTAMAAIPLVVRRRGTDLEQSDKR